MTLEQKAGMRGSLFLIHNPAIKFKKKIPNLSGQTRRRRRRSCVTEDGVKNLCFGVRSTTSVYSYSPELVVSLQQGGISCVWSEDNHIQVPHAAAAAEVPLSQNPNWADP